MSTEAGNKQRLLIVDDSKVIRVTARKILQDHFATVEAVDGENAWEILNNEEPFSLIVSDLTMPNLDGFGLIERIRSSHTPHINSVPVIVITGANDCETTKERATRAGATDFIGKPFDSVHLLARTQAHANAHTVTRALTDETIALEDKATIDPLTELANEAGFMDRGYEQLSYAVRHSTSLAVFRIEIDGFGILYKQHGKKISESVIKSVATVMQSDVRSEDLAARTGAARFALLLPDMGKTGVYNLAQRLNSDISTRLLKQGEDRIRATVSIGVAAPDIRRDTRFEELLSSADTCLAKAIAKGGNNVVFEGIENTDQPAVATQPVESELQLEEIEVADIETTSELKLEEIEVADIEATSELQLEEIVVTDIEATVDQTDIVTIELPAAEFRTNEAPAPALTTPAAVATATSETVTDTEALPATEPFVAITATPDIPEEDSVFADLDELETESIIITAPFDGDTPFEVEVEVETAVEPVPTAPTITATPDTSDIPDTPHLYTTREPLPQEETAPPGLFRRIFTGMRSLFSRSG